MSTFTRVLKRVEGSNLWELVWADGETRYHISAPLEEWDKVSQVLAQGKRAGKLKYIHIQPAGLRGVQICDVPQDDDDAMYATFSCDEIAMFVTHIRQTVRDQKRESGFTLKQVALLRGALLDAMQDIQQWLQIARYQRTKMDTNLGWTPTTGGIRWSEELIAELQKVYRDTKPAPIPHEYDLGGESG